MSLLLEILAAWLLIDVIVVAVLWFRPRDRRSSREK